MLIIDMLGFFQNYSHIHVFKFVLYPRKVVRDGVRVDKIKGSRNLSYEFMKKEGMKTKISSLKEALEKKNIETSFFF